MNPHYRALHCLATCIAFGLQAVDGIVAGKYANEGDFPFAIVILKEHQVICGGVLVTREHVFTGCHCVGSWSETSECSTVKWEPDQTAYDFNFSTPKSDVRKMDLQFRESERLMRNGKSTTQINDEYMKDFRHKSKTLRENEPSTNKIRSPDSSDQLVPTGNPFGSPSTSWRLSATASAHHLHRRQPSTSDDPTNTTVPTTTDSNSSTVPDGNTSTPTTTTTTTTAVPTTTDNISTVSDGNTSMPTTEGKFNPFSLTEVHMVAGTVWIYKFSRGQLRRAGNSFKHPRCNAKTIPWDYDFGIYRANAPFLLDEKRLYPMRIYHRDNEIFSRRFQSMIEGGAMCQTIGWGATQLLSGNDNPYDHTFNRTAVNMSEKLKHTDVKLVTDEVCNELLCFPPYNFCNGSDFHWAEVGIVCAIHVSGGDSCDIDDGNALICDGHVFGFANSGLDCMSNIPRFYTRLDYALDFYYSSVNSGTPSYLISLLMSFTTIMVIIFY